MDRKIGEGRTAEIFVLDDDRIAKVFRSHIPDYFIDHELKISQKVQELKINVPKVYGIEEIDGRHAIVYEKVEGETLLAILARRPWKVNGIAKQMAYLHSEIHSRSGEGLPRFKENLMRNIKQVEELTDNEKEIVIEYLDALPDVAQLCHGDYHPDNVLVSSKGAVIIDWTTAVSGNPLADVARTAMILKYAALPDEMPKLIRYLFHRIRPLLYKNYLNTYIKISGNQLEEIKRWELPIMAARLIEGVPKEEKKTLCSKIREKISR